MTRDMSAFRDPTDIEPFGTFAPNAMQRAVIAAAHGSSLKRGAFRPMLSRLVALFGSTPIDAMYQGEAFRLHPQGNATECGVLFNPAYNLPELDFLREYAPVGGVFVDIGANVGTYAITLARHVGEHGKVVAIEPHPVTVARLKFNAAVSRLSNIVIVAAAAGETDGELRIETDRGNLGASHISTAQTGTRVSAYRLLTILRDAGITRIDALKIDIEGYEDRVLTGFFRDAPQSLWPRAVAIEHLERAVWKQDCIADMTRRGYAVAGKTRNNTLLVRTT